MEELDFSGLPACYSDKGRTGYNPILLYAVVTHANMRGGELSGLALNWPGDTVVTHANMRGGKLLTVWWNYVKGILP